MSFSPSYLKSIGRGQQWKLVHLNVSISQWKKAAFDLKQSGVLILIACEVDESTCENLVGCIW